MFAASHVLDQLELAVFHRPLAVGIGEVEGVADSAGTVGEGGHEAGPLHAGGASGAGQFAEGGEDVEEVGVGRAAFALGYAGTGDDQGYADAVLVAVLFAEESVLAEGQTVVAGEDENRVVENPLGLQAGEHAAELGVEMGDHRVILGDVLPRFLGSARETGQLFVADMQGAGIEGMAAHEVLGEGDGGWVVHLQILLGHGARIMGGQEGDVGVEGGV